MRIFRIEFLAFLLGARPQPVDPKGDDAKKYMKDEIYPKCASHTRGGTRHTALACARACGMRVLAHARAAHALQREGAWLDALGVFGLREEYARVLRRGSGVSRVSRR